MLAQDSHNFVWQLERNPLSDLPSFAPRPCSALGEVGLGPQALFEEVPPKPSGMPSCRCGQPASQVLEACCACCQSILNQALGSLGGHLVGGYHVLQVAPQPCASLGILCSPWALTLCQHWEKEAPGLEPQSCCWRMCFQVIVGMLLMLLIVMLLVHMMLMVAMGIVVMVVLQAPLVLVQVGLVVVVVVPLMMVVVVLMLAVVMVPLVQVWLILHVAMQSDWCAAGACGDAG